MAKFECGDEVWRFSFDRVEDIALEYEGRIQEFEEDTVATEFIIVPKVDLKYMYKSKREALNALSARLKELLDEEGITPKEPDLITWRDVP